MANFLGIPTAFWVLAIAFGCLIAVRDFVRDIERGWRKTGEYAVLRIVGSFVFVVVWWWLVYLIFQWYFTLPYHISFGW